MSFICIAPPLRQRVGRVAALAMATAMAMTKATAQVRSPSVTGVVFAALLAVIALAPTAARAQLPTDWRTAYARTGLPMDSLGLQVVQVDGDRQLAAWNAERAFVLASTTKVVTTLAALDVLGPSYRWRTMAFLDGLLIDGRLLGDLLIVGGGDAHLQSEDLRQWLQAMRAQGLNEVLGDIVLDRSAFRLSDADHAGTPPPSAARPHHAWPEALTLDEGVLHVALQPPAAPGRGARPGVALMPALAGVTLVNQVSGAGGCDARAAWLEPRPGTAQVVVRGGWSAACGDGELSVVMPVLHDYMRRAVGAQWAAVGGKLGGRVRVRHAPGSDSAVPRGDDGELMMPWSVHRSPPLSALVRGINKTSHNPAARNLMLSLVPGFPLRPATLAQAQARLDDWLRTQGLAPGDIVVDNGSGLSRAERGKPAALVTLLRNAWKSPHAQTFIDSLPVAGVDGTLAHRLERSIATGQAHLKTGTLHDTRALAGYVRGRSGRMYALVATVNHPNAARAKPALDALVEWVVRNG